MMFWIGVPHPILWPDLDRRVPHFPGLDGGTPFLPLDKEVPLSWVRMRVAPIPGLDGSYHFPGMDGGYNLPRSQGGGVVNSTSHSRTEPGGLPPFPGLDWGKNGKDWGTHQHYDLMGVPPSLGRLGYLPCKCGLTNNLKILPSVILRMLEIKIHFKQEFWWQTTSTSKFLLLNHRLVLSFCRNTIFWTLLRF